MKHLFTLILLMIGVAVTAQEDSLEYDSVPEPVSYHRDRRFFLNAEFGYGTAYRSISSTQYLALIKCRNGHENGAQVFSAGMYGGYSIYGWWRVRAGIQYFETGFQFSEEKTFRDTAHSEFTVGCDVYNAVDPRIGFIWYAFYDPRFLARIEGAHPEKAEMNVNVRYYYVAFPLSTEFTAAIRTTHFRDFRLFVSGGITPNYMIRQRYDIRFKNEDWEFIAQDSIGVPANFIRRWNLSTSISVGISLLQRDNFEINLELNRQDQLLDLFGWQLYAKYDYKEKHHVTRGVLSVTYFL